MLESWGKVLLLTGGLIAAVGLLLFLSGRLGLGRLPGDIVLRGENFTFYFPLATMLLVSALLTLLISLLGRFFK